jgi:hypothetical protein
LLRPLLLLLGSCASATETLGMPVLLLLLLLLLPGLSDPLLVALQLTTLSLVMTPLCLRLLFLAA